MWNKARMIDEQSLKISDLRNVQKAGVSDRQRRADVGRWASSMPQQSRSTSELRQQRSSQHCRWSGLQSTGSGTSCCSCDKREAHRLDDHHVQISLALPTSIAITRHCQRPIYTAKLSSSWRIIAELVHCVKYFNKTEIKKFILDSSFAYMEVALLLDRVNCFETFF